jgi:23S rRNA (cytidine2498-2'-O)-methyltransferase
MTRPRSPAPRSTGSSPRKRADARTARDRVLDVYLADPDYADICARELGLKKRPPGDGVFAVAAGALQDPCFAHQVLPRARLVRGSGPNDLANLLLEINKDAVLTALDVQVTAPEVARVGSARRDLHPLADAATQLLEILHKKIAGRAAKHGEKPPSGHVLRALVIDAWGVYASLEPARSGPMLLAWPSRFSGGQPLDETSKDAPSSAHRKIEEALLLLEDGPRAGELVVDLGAAPGGWSHVMLERGARVIAVDRADLDDKLLKNERLTHVRSDAFGYTPPEAPAWWLCDVIAEPQRALEVARAALGRPQTRGLVVTLKLTRPVDLEVLAAAKKLAAHTPGFIGRIKQLASNKLEATLMMRR